MIDNDQELPSTKVVKSEFSPLIVDDDDPDSNKLTLRRNLTFWHGFSFVVGMLLGSGLFISPGLVAAASPNMFVTIMWWILGGLLAALGASCFCELSCLFHKTGSTFIFVTGAYGPVAGFVMVFLQAAVLAPVVCSIIAYSAGSYIARPFYEDDSSASFLWTAKAIGLSIFLLLSIINCIGVKEFGFASTVFAVSQVLIVLLLIALGIWQLATTKNFDNFEAGEVFKDFQSLGSWSGIRQLGFALYAVLWAYEGWSCVPYLMEEIKNPSRNIPLITFTSLPFVTLIYVILNLALMAALTVEEIGQSETVGITMAVKVAGKKFSFIMPILVAVCCFGTLNSSIYITGRAYLSASREGQFPSVLSWIHRNRRTPIPAIITNACFTCIWMAAGNSAQTFINYFNFVSWATYFLAFMAIPILRRTRPSAERTYKVNLITPIFLSIFAVLAAILGFAAAPIGSSISLLLILVALPIYYLFIHKKICESLCSYRCEHIGRRMRDIFNMVPCGLEDIE